MKRIIRRIRICWHASLWWLLERRKPAVWGYHELEWARLRAEIAHEYWSKPSPGRRDAGG